MCSCDIYNDLYDFLIWYVDIMTLWYYDIRTHLVEILWWSYMMMTHISSRFMWRISSRFLYNDSIIWFYDNDVTYLVEIYVTCLVEISENPYSWLLRGLMVKSRPSLYFSSRVLTFFRGCAIIRGLRSQGSEGILKVL